MLFLIPLALAQSPTDLADEAVSNHPGLEAKASQTRRLEALAAVSDLWPDPMLGFEYSNMAVDAPLPGNHPMSGVQFKATQMLPAPGTTALRAEVAQGRVEISEAMEREAELRLRKQVEQTWWRLALSRAMEAVTEAHLERTEELVAAVRSQYETGSAGQSALLRLQLLSDRLADDLGDYERVDVELSAALAAALSRPEARFETPETLDAAPLDGTVEDWLAQALDSRPELARLDWVAANERRSAELAKVEGRPDPTLWAGYRVRTQDMDGTDLVSLGVSLPIPVHSGRRAEGIAAAHLEAASAAEAEREAAIDGLEASLRRAHARWQRALDKELTYEEVLLPAAEATLETTLSDYRVGKTDFASLYDAEVGLLMLERARLTAVAETRIQAAEVRALTGGSP